MKRILLCCAAGMSTSLLVTKMQKAAEAQGIEAKIWAVSATTVNKEAEDADCVLLGPQVRYLEKKVTTELAPLPVALIDMRNYGAMNGEAVLKQALDLIGD